MSGLSLQRSTLPHVRRLIVGVALAALLVDAWLNLSTPQPAYSLVPRAVWDHASSPVHGGREQTVRRIIIHHDAVEFAPERSGEEKVGALLRAAHGEDWSDLPYHYLVDRDGRVFEGRPEHLVGDTHTKYDPADALHIALMGNYAKAEPSEAQVRALIALVEEKARTYGLPAGAIQLHNQLAATECPGQYAIERLAAVEWSSR